MHPNSLTQGKKLRKENHKLNIWPVIGSLPLSCQTLFLHFHLALPQILVTFQCLGRGSYCVILVLQVLPILNGHFFEEILQVHLQEFVNSMHLQFEISKVLFFHFAYEMTDLFCLCLFRVAFWTLYQIDLQKVHFFSILQSSITVLVEAGFKSALAASRCRDAIAATEFANLLIEEHFIGCGTPFIVFFYM